MARDGAQNLLQEVLMGEQFCDNNHSTVRSALQWERTTQAYSAHGYSISREVYQNEIFKKRKKERKKTLKGAVQKARREQAA